jgi:hypothetical protein
MRTLTLTLGLLLSAGLPGCSQIHRPEQAQQGEQVNTDAFLHQHLQREPMVTVAEAYRAMILLADGDDSFPSFAAREESLLQRKIVRPEWKLDREMVIDRGSVAYMVLQILKIRGGVNFNVMGRLGIADRRYAVRELTYMEMMGSTPPYRYISGAELVDLVGKADTYMAEHGLYPEERVDVVEMVESRPAPK